MFKSSHLIIKKSLFFTLISFFLWVNVTYAQDSESVNIKDYKDELLYDPLSPTAGNKDGTINIVYFFDYRCPYCKVMHTSLDKLISENKELRVVFKELPILSRESYYVAQLALAANEQGKYYELHSKLMENQAALTEDNIFNLAESVGINVSKLKEDSKNPKIHNALKSTYELAKKISISGTPSYIIGNEVIVGHTTYEEMQKAIQKAKK